MTDERRAVCTREKCGHRQFLHTTVSDDGNGTYCGECGDYCGWPEFIVPALFEETPSTDEGEALGLTEAQMHAEADKRYKLPREGGTYSGNEALRQRWAFVNGAKWGAAEARAPLEETVAQLRNSMDAWSVRAIEAEERIRELEEAVRELDTDRAPTVALAHETYNRMVAAEAEVERLREALRPLVDKILGPDEGAEAWDELVDLADAGMRALATPPSSTEGTNTLKANFDGCPFCGGDDSVGIHRIGRCEGTKES